MRRRNAGLTALALVLCLVFPAKAEKKITLTFAGDVTLGCQEFQKELPESFNAYAEREGYGWFFRNMTELFSSDDLTLVNLEGTLTDSSQEEDRSKTFRFRGPTDYAKILTMSSIEACSVSNNHIMDFGRQGYESTLATLEKNGILYCGNEHSFIFEKDGIRIGFFALGNMYFNNYAQVIKKEAARMRAEGVNAIVMSFHAGQEYTPHRRDWDQENRARIAVTQWGADLVIMHHPHVVQGVDVVDQRYAFYSLGNFCFGGNPVIEAKQKNKEYRALESMVVQMDLVFGDDGAYLGQEGRIYPCYVSSSATRVGDPNDYQPKFVTGEQAQGVIDRIQYDTAFTLAAMDEESGCLTLPFLPAEK